MPRNTVVSLKSQREARTTVSVNALIYRRFRDLCLLMHIEPKIQLHLMLDRWSNAEEKKISGLNVDQFLNRKE